ncbi:MAG: AfsA-related hotdog domain-containing protein [Actinophytocola sp.]|uniref:AfsA-related hotdog domain-containing protein n=1 Tax=Actinophytocola sp. TaxID=1872138 RepID=UPI003D6B873B
MGHDLADTVSHPVSHSVTHDRILPKKLVHKDGFDDVFLTSFASLGERESVLGATLPRSHGFYCEFPVTDRAPDLALLVEICRQACFVVAHNQFDVPLGGPNDAKFLMKAMSGEFVDTTPFETDEPVNIAVACTIEEVSRRRGEVSGLVWAFTVRVGDVVVARARMAQTMMSRTIWGQLRGRLRTERGLPVKMAPVEPPRPSTLTATEVGRLNPANVVLGEVFAVDGEYVAKMRVDLRHPVMFDHPADYVFAMVQLEASRQLALVAASRALGVPATELAMWSVDSEFVAVAEFDLATRLRATVRAARTEQGLVVVDVENTQQQRKVSALRVAVRHG